MFSDEQLLSVDFDDKAYIRYVLHVSGRGAAKERSRLDSCIAQVKQRVRSALGSQVDAMIDQVHATDDACEEVRAAQQITHSLVKASERLRWLIAQPYQAIASGVTELENTQTVLHVLQWVLDHLTLTARLEEPSYLEGDVVRAARTVHEVQARMQSVEGRQVRGLHVVQREMQRVDRVAANVRHRAQEMLSVPWVDSSSSSSTAGITPSRQTPVKDAVHTALQCFHLLDSIPRTLNNVVAEHKRELRRVVMRELDAEAVAREIAQNSNVTNSNNVDRESATSIQDIVLSHIETALKSVTQHTNGIAVVCRVLLQWIVTIRVTQLEELQQHEMQPWSTAATQAATTVAASAARVTPFQRNTGPPTPMSSSDVQFLLETMLRLLQEYASSTMDLLRIRLVEMMRRSSVQHILVAVYPRYYALLSQFIHRGSDSVAVREFVCALASMTQRHAVPSPTAAGGNSNAGGGGGGGALLSHMWHQCASANPAGNVNSSRVSAARYYRDIGAWGAGDGIGDMGGFWCDFIQSWGIGDLPDLIGAAQALLDAMHASADHHNRNATSDGLVHNNCTNTSHGNCGTYLMSHTTKSTVKQDGLMHTNGTSLASAANSPVPTTSVTHTARLAQGTWLHAVADELARRFVEQLHERYNSALLPAQHRLASLAAQASGSTGAGSQVVGLGAHSARRVSMPGEVEVLTTTSLTHAMMHDLLYRYPRSDVHSRTLVMQSVVQCLLDWRRRLAEVAVTHPLPPAPSVTSGLTRTQLIHVCIANGCTSLVHELSGAVELTIDVPPTGSSSVPSVSYAVRGAQTPGSPSSTQDSNYIHPQSIGLSLVTANNNNNDDTTGATTTTTTTRNGSSAKSDGVVNKEDCEDESVILAHRLEQRQRQLDELLRSFTDLATSSSQPFLRSFRELVLPVIRKCVSAAWAGARSSTDGIAGGGSSASAQVVYTTATAQLHNYIGHFLRYYYYLFDGRASGWSEMVYHTANVFLARLISDTSTHIPFTAQVHTLEHSSPAPYSSSSSSVHVSKVKSDEKNNQQFCDGGSEEIMLAGLRQCLRDVLTIVLEFAQVTQQSGSAGGGGLSRSTMLLRSALRQQEMLYTLRSQVSTPLQHVGSTNGDAGQVDGDAVTEMLSSLQSLSPLLAQLLLLQLASIADTTQTCEVDSSNYSSDDSGTAKNQVVAGPSRVSGSGKPMSSIEHVMIQMNITHDELRTIVEANVLQWSGATPILPHHAQTMSKVTALSEVLARTIQGKVEAYQSHGQGRYGVHEQHAPRAMKVMLRVLQGFQSQTSS